MSDFGMRDPDKNEALATLAEAMPAIVFVCRDGRNLFVNSRYRAFTGLSDDSLLDSGYRDVIHADDLGIIDALPSSHADGATECKFRLKRHDGTYRWVKCRSATMADNDGSVVLGTMIDVHDETMIAAALAASQARLTFAQEAGDIALWDWDVGTNETWWSGKLYELLGLPASADGTTLEDFFDHVHPDDRRRVQGDLDLAVAEGRFFESEFRIVRADGTVRWLAGRGNAVRDENDKIVRMLGVNFDISEQKRLEAELRDLNATLETRVEEQTAERDRLWALSRDLLVQARYDGQILRVSPSVTRFVAQGTANMANVIHSEDRAKWDHVVGSMQQRGVPTECVTRLMAGDESRQISWSIAPDPKGDSFVAVGRDISDIVRAQRRIRETEERLAQIQRMETLGELASGVAHDFNNLLGPILGVLDMLQRRPQGDAELDELVKGGSQAAMRARELVRRILAFAQRRQQTPEIADLGDLLANLKDLLRNTLPQTIQMTLSSEDALPPIRIQANQLELAILNLAINAGDAMPDGGTLTISATLDGANHIRLSVADTGCGMEEATLKSATEAFFTTKEAGKGTGLGLFMAKRLAETSGGSLEVESVVGRGTTVSFVLPARRDSRNMKRR